MELTDRIFSKISELPRQTLFCIDAFPQYVWGFYSTKDLRSLKQDFPDIKVLHTIRETNVIRCPYNKDINVPLFTICDDKTKQTVIQFIENFIEKISE
jgi:hypothetical protein